MIETSISIIGILFIMLNKIIFINNDDINVKIYTKKQKYFYISWLLLSICCFIPIFEETSIAKFIYSFFDKTSYLCTLLIVMICVKIIIKNIHQTKHSCKYYALFNILDSIRFKLLHAIIIVLLGSIFYAGALGFMNFDIYHLNVIYQGIMTLIFLVFLYIINYFVGILGLISIILFCFFGDYNQSILESLICPYIYFYCIIYIALYTIKYFTNTIFKLYK